MKKIQVLLSTFNGEKYLTEQLDSILNQNGVDVYCLIRDDGSVDKTKELLEQYIVNPKVEVVYGDNIGYKDSFNQLIELAGDFDFYAFADQDDVWLPLKLKTAISKLEGNETPAMYCSNCMIVNSELENISLLHSEDLCIVPDNNIKSLFQGFAHGCTIVFNQKSKELVLAYNPKNSYAHDFWVPLLHVFFGQVVYDNNSYILYRQHDNNIFGGKRSIIQLIKNKISFSIESRNFYSKLAKEIINGYKNLLTNSDYKELLTIVNYDRSIKNRLKLIFNKNIKKRTFRGTLFLKHFIFTPYF